MEIAGLSEVKHPGEKDVIPLEDEVSDEDLINKMIPEDIQAAASASRDRELKHITETKGIILSCILRGHSFLSPEPSSMQGIFILCACCITLYQSYFKYVHTVIQY